MRKTVEENSYGLPLTTPFILHNHALVGIDPCVGQHRRYLGRSHVAEHPVEQGMNLYIHGNYVSPSAWGSRLAPLVSSWEATSRESVMTVVHSLLRRV